MDPQHVVITQDFNLPVERVFNALADHNNLKNVFGVPVKRIKDGIGDVNGVGSVRALGIGPIATEETILAVKQNESIDYEITRNGGPIMNHHGRIDFARTGSGSRVTWTIAFESYPVVGGLIAKGLEFAVSRGLKKLG